MLSTEAIRRAAADLAPLDVPIISRPRYGEGSVRDYEWHTRNHKKGWVNIPAAFSVGTQGYFTTWSLTIEACAVLPADAEALAGRIDHLLSHLSRTPTNYRFMGDQVASDPSSVKHVLTFMAQMRQGD